MGSDEEPVNVDPFPHAVIDWWFDKELLEAVASEFPRLEDRRWLGYKSGNEVKYEGGPQMWGMATCEYFDVLESRTPELEAMFGIADLSMEMVGGGYHLIPPGGRLAMHADFNRSPETDLYRRLNVLTYLNPDWTPRHGGFLVLGDCAEVRVAPEMGRTVIFATSASSWHGHPEPTTRWRKSVAAYFFSPEPAPGYVEDNSTVWL